MNIFLSHATDDKPIAEPIAHSIRARGHKVFFDLDDLPPGDSYESRIEVAIKRCDIFVFLISPRSIEQGRYTLTEMGLARRKWPTPSGRVLPVMISETAFEAIPPYLRVVTVLRPKGNTAAETAAEVDLLRPKWSPMLRGKALPRRYWASLLAIVVVSTVALGAWSLIEPVPQERGGSCRTSTINNIPENKVDEVSAMWRAETPRPTSVTSKPDAKGTYTITVVYGSCS